MKQATLSSVAVTGATLAGGLGTRRALGAPVRQSGNEILTGSGAYQYRVRHQFLQLPSPYTWQTT
ncbi:MAG: hypothetical protein ACKOET_20240, partial [Verrucomicrobiota bacterium]